jgi:hypothetical protein
MKSHPLEKSRNVRNTPPRNISARRYIDPNFVVVQLTSSDSFIKSTVLLVHHFYADPHLTFYFDVDPDLDPKLS